MAVKTGHLLACAVGTLVAVILLRTIKVGSKENAEREVYSESDGHITVGEEHFNRLSRAIQIRTISYSPTDYNRSALLLFHQFLRQEFPDVFTSSLISTEVINNHSFLFTVPGSDKSLQPFLLMSHIDVVPAVSPEWSVEPFSGLIDDDYIWGRGAIDVKNTLMAIVEVLNVMAKSGRQPRRTFYVAFGHDEEIGGRAGAGETAKLLLNRGLRFGFILDEGMAVVKDVVVPGPAALIGVGEKGLFTLRLKVNMTGGHSSMPKEASSLSVMARAVARLSHTAHPHRFGQGVEVDMMQHLAPHFPFATRVIISNLWLFGPLVAWMMCRKPETAAGIRTTTSVTIFNSGIKANVIPAYAEAIVNHRVHPGDTFEDVVQHNHHIIGDDRVRIERAPDLLADHPPSPLSSTTSFGYSVIKKTIRQIFNNIPVAPAICVGNTDTRHYLKLSDNVYRFTPTVFLPGDSKRFHGPNERITKDNYKLTVNFYNRIILNAAVSDSHYETTHPPHDL